MTEPPKIDTPDQPPEMTSRVAAALARILRKKAAERDANDSPASSPDGE